MRLHARSHCSMSTRTRLSSEVAAGKGADVTVGMRIPADRGIAGWAVMAGQPIAIDDVRQDPRFAVDVAEITGYVPASIMAMPLDSERRTFGVIEVLDRRRSGGEGADDLEVLALFARQATLAVETSRIFANLAQELFASAALAAPGQDLRMALEQRAAVAPRPQAELAQLACSSRSSANSGPMNDRRCANRRRFSRIFTQETPLKPASSWQFEPATLERIQVSLPPAITREWAWGGSTGSGVKVGVIDSGIDAAHPGVGPLAGGGVVVPKSDAPRGALVIEGPHEDLFGHGRRAPQSFAGRLRRLSSQHPCAWWEADWSRGGFR